MLRPAPRRYRVASIDTDSWVERWIVTTAVFVALGVIAYTSYGTWGPVLLNTITRS